MSDTSSTQPKWWRRRSESTTPVLLPTLLPSEWDAARFQAEFSVYWRKATATPDRTALAQNELTRWAAVLSRSRSVLDAAILQADLNASLRRGTPIAAFDPAIHRASVRIFVSQPDWRAAQERNALMQEAQLVALRQDAHAHQLRFIRDTVLSDPALMMAWLLEANMSDPGKILQHEEKLRALADAVTPDTVNIVAVQIAKIAARFIDRLERPALRQLLDSLGTIMSSYQEDDLAGQLPQWDEIDHSSS